MAETLTASVVVCTRNRAASLRRTLGSLTAMAVPPALRWEIVVVDNASTDGTQRAVRDVAAAAPVPVTCVTEPTPGLSRARNAGVAAARGAVLAFTDDDVVADPGWLAAVVAEFEADPRIQLVLGQTRRAGPDAPGLSTVEGGVRRVYAYPSTPWLIGHGNNMAIRRAVLERIGPFDVRLGAGTAAAAAEDTDYVYRVLKAGGLVVYAPSAVVVHCHDRPSPEAELAVHAAYARGRGAFYAKHLLRGDPWPAKLFLGEAVSQTWRAAADRRRRRKALRTLGALASGFSSHLVAEIGQALLRPRQTATARRRTA